MISVHDYLFSRVIVVSPVLIIGASLVRLRLKQGAHFVYLC